MEIISGKRGTGKTKALIVKAAEENGRIVTVSVIRAKSIREKAKAMGYTINEPATWIEVMRDPGKYRSENLMVDDLDEVLEGVFGGSVVSCVVVSDDTPEKMKFPPLKVSDLDEEGDLWKCPNCGAVVGKSFDYAINECPVCGRAIDYSNIDEFN